MTSRHRYSRRWLIIFGLLGTLCAGLFLVVVLVGALVIAGKGEHLLWVLTKRPLYRKWARSVAVDAMPVAVPPEDHKLLSIGSVQITCSSEFVASSARSEKDVSGQGIILKDNGRGVVVSLPQDSTESMRAFEEFVRTGVPKRFRQSMYRMHVEIYKARIDEFRWSMTTEELQYLNWRLANKMFLSPPGGKVETLFRDDIEGMLTILPNTAFFGWITTDGTAAGHLLFSQQSGPLDLEWVRSICGSLKFTGEVYPEDVPEKTIEEILQDIDGI